MLMIIYRKTDIYFAITISALLIGKLFNTSPLLFLSSQLAAYDINIQQTNIGATTYNPKLAGLNEEKVNEKKQYKKEQLESIFSE